MIPGAALNGAAPLPQGPMTEATEKRAYVRKPKDEPMTEATDETSAFVRKTAKEMALAPPEDPVVSVRVTKRGADKISTGKHYPDLGDEFYAQGEVFEVAKSTADILEDRGFVEIQ